MIYTKICLNILAICCQLAIASWIISILARNNPYDVSGQLFGYALTELIVGILRIPVSCLNICTKEPSKVNSFFTIVSIGLFIWNCVLLFNQIGVQNVDTNAYTMYVYVQFILYCIGLGLGLLIMCGACCVSCVLLANMDSEPAPAPSVIPVPVLTSPKNIQVVVSAA